MAKHPRNRQRSSLYEALVGAWSSNRLRAHLRSSVRRFSGGARPSETGGTNVPRSPGHRLRHRRCPGTRRTPPMEEGWDNSAMNQHLHKLTICLLAAALTATGQQLPAAKPESVGLSSERLERIATLVQRGIDEKRIAGAVTLVARRGHIAWLKSQSSPSATSAFK